MGRPNKQTRVFLSLGSRHPLRTFRGWCSALCTSTANRTLCRLSGDGLGEAWASFFFCICHFRGLDAGERKMRKSKRKTKRNRKRKRERERDKKKQKRGEREKNKRKIKKRRDRDRGREWGAREGRNKDKTQTKIGRTIKIKKKTDRERERETKVKRTRSVLQSSYSMTPLACRTLLTA